MRGSGSETKSFFSEMTLIEGVMEDASQVVEEYSAPVVALENATRRAADKVVDCREMMERRACVDSLERILECEN